MALSKYMFALLGIFFVTAALGKERIVGGIIAKPKHRRYLAQIIIQMSDGGGSCTGSVISSRHILTAAHCFDGITGEDDVSNVVRDSYLYVGLKTANPSNNEKWYDFEAIYVHKDYDETDSAARNDVAIVKITEDIPSDSLFTVRLSKAPKNNKIVTVAGYGALDEDGTSANFAMQTKVIHKSFGICKAAENGGITSLLKKRYHVCAVSLGYPDEGRTDSCYGDSGGPVFKRRGVQFGITSFSTSGCAEAGGIPWYARVSSYKRPIRDVMSTGSSDSFILYD